MVTYGAELKLCTRSCERNLKSVSLSEKDTPYSGQQLTEIFAAILIRTYTWHLLLLLRNYIDQVKLIRNAAQITMLISRMAL